MSASHVVVPLGLLHMRKIQRWFHFQHLDPKRHKWRMLTIPPSLQSDPVVRVTGGGRRMATSPSPPHKLPGTDHGAEGIETLHPSGSGETCRRAHRQHYSCSVRPAIGDSQEPPAVCPQSSVVPRSGLHSRGYLNRTADLISRGGPSHEWKLNPSIVQKLWSRFGKAEVDLFASRENTQCAL